MKIYPCIIGLGYVGLPLFIRLSKNYSTIGFDINKSRIKELKSKIDLNSEYNKKELILNNNSNFTYNAKDIQSCNFFIITVPTPIYKNKKPDLRPLILATKIISKYIKKNDIVFYESTVYPGVTEEVCSKIIEKVSKLKSQQDFFVGYSPERINPGDSEHKVEKINKIVAFKEVPSEIKNKIINVYKKISKKIILSNSIKESETSKVIENIQRDINIAFVNEIFMICRKLDLNFSNIIKLASTKWNFLKFSPGLVGGHCLPVDPYYLYALAKKNSINAKFMLAGRNVNNEMENFVYKSIIKKINSFNCKKILIAGVTYKANVADVRNSLALNIYKRLKKNKKFNTYCFDPIINNKYAKKYKILDRLNFKINFDLIVPLVSHTRLLKDLNLYKNSNTIFFDIFDFYKE
jgi:UDP-N-acetyl-D-galactosamine dehydrogenase